MSNDKINSKEGALHGKIAIITGGASGIGKATAELFSREGASVAIVDVDLNGGKETAQSIVKNGFKAMFIPCDVSSEEDCRNTVKDTISFFGGLDILFNNAGIIKRTSVLDISVEEWDRVMAVNIRSIFLMSKFAIPPMEKGGGGVIINTGSGWGLKGGGNAVSYCASKGAVVNMTRAMAIDHGPQNIRVNSVCPGDTYTAMLLNEAEQLGESKESFMKEAADRPLGRYGIPEDIAKAALFLVSENSSFVSGTHLLVDGGGLA